MTEKINRLLDNHRHEWELVTMLRNEALSYRAVDIKKAIKLAKTAKTATQAMLVKQYAERKAYGLD